MGPKQSLVGREGDVHVAVVVLRPEAGTNTGRGAFALRHSDDTVIVVLVDPNCLAKRIFHRKQHLGRLRRNHGHIIIALVVQPGDKPAAGQDQAVEFLVVGQDAHHPGLELTIEVAHVLAELPDRRHRHHGRNGVFDTSHVREGQAVTVQTLVPVELVFLGRLDAADDDVGCPQLLDLLDGFVTGGLADGQHGDHRAHPQHDPQYREGGTKLVSRQAQQAGTRRMIEPVQGHGLTRAKEARLLWRSRASRTNSQFPPAKEARLLGEAGLLEQTLNSPRLKKPGFLEKPGFSNKLSIPPG